MPFLGTTIFLVGALAVQTKEFWKALEWVGDRVSEGFNVLNPIVTKGNYMENAIAKSASERHGTSEAMIRATRVLSKANSIVDELRKAEDIIEELPPEIIEKSPNIINVVRKKGMNKVLRVGVRAANRNSSLRGIHPNVIKAN